MPFQVYIAYFAWPAVVLLMFVLMPPRRAMLTAIVGGWLFLPVASIDIPGLPAADKHAVVSLPVLLCALVFDPPASRALMPRWFDLPMVVWCLSSLPTAIDNGLGFYDGFSGVLRAVLTWGIPYFLGRVYFTDLQAARQLAIAVVIGGLIYIPLCLFEARMSPQLHTMLYGYHQHDFGQTYRWGGWRPVVFLEHGLAVGMWMCFATVSAIWLWRTRAATVLGGIPMVLAALGLLVTFVLCKSLGAIVLMLVGLMVLVASRWFKTRWVLYALAAAPLMYIVARTSLGVDAHGLVAAASQLSESRAQSLQYRLDNEDLLVRRALERPLWGWGRWGRNGVTSEDGRIITVTDGLWVLILGTGGLVGLAGLYGSMLIPPVLALRRIPAGMLSHPAVAPLTGLIVVVILNALDSIPNAPSSPVLSLAAGALAAVAAARGRTIAEVRPEQRVQRVRPVGAAHAQAGGPPTWPLPGQPGRGQPGAGFLSR